MTLINEKIDHIVFGEGMVIGQNDGRLTIQFSEQYGIKQFMYPDAFEKHLKLFNEDSEQSILKELNDKQQKIEAERLLRLQQREQEELERKMALKRQRRNPHPEAVRARQKPWRPGRNPSISS